jgi:O-antigen/teichoic acid export membrane protein
MLKKQYLLRDSFVYKVFTLITGIGVSQVIPIVFSPVLTRLYTPEDFGSLAFFMASSSIGAIVSTGRYELAIMLPKDSEEALNLLIVTIFLSLSISILIFIILFLFGNNFLCFLNYPLTFSTVLFIPLGIFTSGCFQGLNFWLNRNSEFSSISKYRVFQASTIVAFSLILSFFKEIEEGLIFSFLIGMFLSVLPIINIIRKNKKLISVDKALNVSKKYSNYPKLLMPTGLFDTIAMQAPIFFITKFFSKIVTGAYSLAFRMVSAPISVISGAFGQVFYNQIVSEVKKGENTSFIIFKTAKQLTFISLALFLPMFFFGQEIFVILFGANWSDAGRYVEIISFAMMIRFIVSPLSTTFLATNSLRLGAFWQALYMTTTLILFFYCSSLKIEKLLFVYTIHEIVLYLIYLFLILFVSKKFDKKNICVA